MTRSVLKAVYDPDLEELMGRLGLLGAFRAGKLKCAFSGEIITWDNLHAFFPEGGDVKAVCDRPQCVRCLVHKLEPPEVAE